MPNTAKRIESPRLGDPRVWYELEYKSETVQFPITGQMHFGKSEKGQEIERDHWIAFHKKRIDTAKKGK